jgi:NADPH:quinone reductase-like Zn-dependent oxidoreductase
MMVELSAFAEKHQLHPPIAQVSEFEEADKALEALRESTGVGKIVVEV